MEQSTAYGGHATCNATKKVGLPHWEQSKTLLSHGIPMTRGHCYGLTSHDAFEGAVVEAIEGPLASTGEAGLECTDPSVGGVAGRWSWLCTARSWLCTARSWFVMLSMQCCMLVTFEVSDSTRSTDCASSCSVTCRRLMSRLSKTFTRSARAKCCDMMSMSAAGSGAAVVGAVVGTGGCITGVAGCAGGCTTGGAGCAGGCITGGAGCVAACHAAGGPSGTGCAQACDVAGSPGGTGIAGAG